MTVHAGNLERAQAWDGDEGLRWTQQEERYDASGAAHAVHLLRAAAIEPDDRAAHRLRLRQYDEAGGSTGE